jgi:hypothetical protein
MLDRKSVSDAATVMVTSAASRNGGRAYLQGHWFCHWGSEEGPGKFAVHLGLSKRFENDELVVNAFLNLCYYLAARKLERLGFGRLKGERFYLSDKGWEFANARLEEG